MRLPDQTAVTLDAEKKSFLGWWLGKRKRRRMSMEIDMGKSKILVTPPPKRSKSCFF